MYSTIKNDPKNPTWQDRDIFVLSKGHASLGQYVAMAQFGYFPIADVYAFGAYELRFGCHPDRHKVPGVEVSTGSLGHGICVAAGMALGFKISRSRRRVVTLIGDGEANEGTVWEALMVAADRRLDNFTVIFDYNKSQTRCLQINNPAERFAAFGCEVTEVSGHDINALQAAISKVPSGKPHVIVADTVKGFGATTLETETFAWHRRSPKPEELSQLAGELDARKV